MSFAATELVNSMLSSSNADGPEMLEAVKQDPKASSQLLLLAHLYAKTDSTSLNRLRKELFRPKYTAKDIAIGTGIGVTALTGEEVVSNEQGRSPCASQLGCFKRFSI